MKIAQIAPLYESVPPKWYGGTERIVHYLTEELICQGHAVTLFATADSLTRARLISHVKQGLRLDKTCVDPLAHHIVQMQEVIDHAHEFDILHFHTDYLHFPFSSLLSVPSVTTLHGRLDIPDLQPVYHMFSKESLISISERQRLPLPRANFIGTVYHGLPESLHRMGSGKGNYLAFLGRISPEKGVDRAIEMAIAANRPLKIAAKVDKPDQSYYDNRIKPLLGHPLIEFVGEINEDQKTAFLGNAQALLFPVQWPEPFGLVMIEAMACGTPVIAFDNGSVPEVVEPGKTGFIVNDVEAGVEAIKMLPFISRADVRRVFEKRFTAEQMAKRYVDLYKGLVQTGAAPFVRYRTPNIPNVFLKQSKNINHAGSINP